VLDDLADPAAGNVPVRVVLTDTGNRQTLADRVVTATPGAQVRLAAPLNRLWAELTG